MNDVQHVRVQTVPVIETEGEYMKCEPHRPHFRLESCQDLAC